MTFKDKAQVFVDEMDNQAKKLLKEQSKVEQHWSFYEYIDSIMCNIIVRKSDDKVSTVIPKSVGKGY